MSQNNQQWNRLSDLARRAPDGAGSLEAPTGFAARVAAQWIALRREGEVWMESAWESLAVRALAVACLVTIVAAAASWPLVSGGRHDEVGDVTDPMNSELVQP